MKYYHRNWPRNSRLRKERDGYRCRTCGRTSAEVQLETHHVTYKNWPNEDIERDLITLCIRCHRAITNSQRKIRYDAREHEIDYIRPVKEAKKNGVEKKKLQIDWHNPASYAQWPISKPTKQVVTYDKRDFIKEAKDRL